MGVFAVILQQLNCSLGYVYVSHAQTSSVFTTSILSCFLLQSSHAGGLFAGACMHARIVLREKQVSYRRLCLS